MTENPAPKRIFFDGIQGLRFIASFIVVICHSTFYASERLGIGERIVWSQGARGVDIFFVISGFVMVVASRRLFENPDGWKVFLEKRILRIIPLYWATTTLSLLALIFASSLVLHDQLDWVHVIKSYLFIPAVNADGQVKPIHGVGWTLTFEMFFYAVFAAALFFRKNVWLFCSAIIIPLSLLYLFRDGDHPELFFYANPIMLEFLAGMYIALAVQKGKVAPLVFAIPLAILSMAYIVLAETPDGVHRAVFSGIPSAILVYCVASIETKKRIPVPNWALFQGKASYSLYLFHPLCAPAAPVILNILGIRIFSLSVILSCIIAIIVGSLGYLFIEESITQRATKWMDGWRDRRAAKIMAQDQNTLPIKPD